MSLPTDDKARKAIPIFTYLTEYFPDATLAEVGVAVAGNEQHSPGQPLHWARGKSTDQMNTAFRHLWDHKRGTVKDIDGQYHLAKAIWRLKAELQLQIEKDNLNAINLCERDPSKEIKSDTRRKSKKRRR
jgi:hypothetical protein